MGERGAYRVSQPRGYHSWNHDGTTVHSKMYVSPVIRKQWYLGGDKGDIENWVLRIATILCGRDNIDGGCSALRSDLDHRRFFIAMVHALAVPPFDSLETSLNCDCDEHGLYEIELNAWNCWTINHYEVDGDKAVDKKRICDVTFTPGRPLIEGTRFDWYYETEYSTYINTIDNMDVEDLPEADRAAYMESKGYRG
jgi:hypothetical protein